MTSFFQSLSLRGSTLFGMLARAHLFMRSSSDNMEALGRGGRSKKKKVCQLRDQLYSKHWVWGRISWMVCSQCCDLDGNRAGKPSASGFSPTHLICRVSLPQALGSFKTQRGELFWVDAGKPRGHTPKEENAVLLLPTRAQNATECFLSSILLHNWPVQ